MDPTLVEENRLLIEELSKCKADKEFVWSLWKQLQSESPELTAAVDTAISREKGKYEAQVVKIVDMVQKKDREIASLKQIIRSQDEKLLEAEVLESKTSAENNQRNDLVKELEERVAALTVIVAESEQQKITNLEKQQMGLTKLTQKVTQLEKERGVTRKICREQDNELKIQRSLQVELNQNISKLSAECAEHVRVSGELEEQLQSKGKQVESLQQSVDHKDAELKHVSEQLKRVQQDLQRVESQANVMHSELEVKRKDVAATQQQLLLAQQQVIVTQQKCSQLEEYAESHRQLQVVREEMEKLKLMVVEREQQIDQFRKVSEAAQSTCQERANSLQSVVQELTSLHEVLIKERTEHEVVVKELKQELLATNDRMLKELELAQQLSSRAESTGSPGGPHIIATAPCQEYGRLTELLVMTEKELFNAKFLLEAKDNELVATRKAHSQRLARMKALQIEYKLVVEQLKTYETEKSPQQKTCNIGRPATHLKGRSPQSGEKLWSQLTNYKKQVEALSKQVSQLGEEKDRMHIKLAREQTTAAGLQANLEADRNELAKKLSVLSNETNTVAEEERKKVKEMEGIIKSLQQEKRSTLNSHKAMEGKYYELQEEMARTKSALLLAEKRAKELTTSPVSIAERCSSAVQTDRLWETTINKPEKFDALWTNIKSLSAHHPHKRVLHSRSLSDTLLLGHDFQDEESSSISELSSRSIIETTVKPVVTQHKKPLGIVTDTMMEKSAPIRVVNVAVQCSCDEKQSLVSKRNHITQQMISKFQRENRSLKHRLDTLSKQVRVLNSSKQSLTQALQQEKERYEILRTEGVSQSDKLQQSKAKVQSLNEEVNKLTEECNTLKQRYDLLESIKMKAASSVADKDKSAGGHSDADWKCLEQRMKSILEKYTAQNSTIQELQQQLYDKTMDHNQAQERLQHCERDVRQKRSLIDNLRSRLRTEKYCQAEWDDTKIGLQQEISTLTERGTQNKQQIDYLKRQLNIEQHEREHLRVISAKCAEELERTLERLDQCRTELQQQEMTAAMENKKLHKATQELHVVHQLQMSQLGSQLKQNDERINEFQTFTKQLAMELAALAQSRIQQPQVTENSDDEMLASRARDIAYSTLNLSASEFKQFVTEAVVEKQSSAKKLIPQIIAVLSSKPPFSVKLVQLFMRIVQNDGV